MAKMRGASIKTITFDEDSVKAALVEFARARGLIVPSASENVCVVDTGDGTLAATWESVDDIFDDTDNENDDELAA